MIDTTGEGFFLTDLQHGVQFRRGPTSALDQFSWTDPAHHNAWLVRRRRFSNQYEYEYVWQSEPAAAEQ